MERRQRVSKRLNKSTNERMEEEISTKQTPLREISERRKRGRPINSNDRNIQKRQ